MCLESVRLKKAKKEISKLLIGSSLAITMETICGEKECAGGERASSLGALRGD